MVNNSENTISNKFHNLENLRKYTLKNLDDAIDDHEYILDGGRLLIAVDFHLIHEFAWVPIEILHRVYSFTTEKYKQKRNEFLVRRTALSHLLLSLHQSGSAYLLPPYAIELSNAMAKEQVRLTRSEIDFQVLKDTINHTLSPEEKSLASDLESHNDSADKPDKLPKELSKRLRKLVNDHLLHNILYLASGFSKNAQCAIKELFYGSTPRLTTKPKLSRQGCLRIANQSVTDSQLSSDNSWVEAFELLKRNSPSNYADSQAVDMIMTLNDNFQSNKCDVKALLFTDAQAIYKLLNAHLFENEKWYKKLPNDLFEKYDNISLNSAHDYHRSLDVITLYLHAANKIQNGDNINDWLSEGIHSEKSKESLRNIINKLKQMKIEVAAKEIDHSYFKTISEKCSNSCKKCDSDLNNLCNKLIRKIKEIENTYLELRSWDAVSNSEPYLQNLDKVGEMEKQTFRAIRAFIKFINDKPDELAEMIRSEREKSENIYNRVNMDLRMNVIDLSDEGAFLPGTARLRSIPIKFEFHNKNISDAVKQMHKRIRSDDDLSISKENAKRIARYLSESDWSTEKYLLISLMLYYSNKLELASKICEEYGPSDDIRFSILKFIALHQDAIQREDLGLYEKARNLCIKENNRLQGDPRLLYILGAMTLRAITREMSNTILPEEGLKHYKKALELIEKDSSKEPMLTAAIHNGMAFGITLNKAKDRNALLIALSHVEQMQDILDINKWHANFLDTKGVVYYHLAQQSKDEREVKEYAKIAHTALMNAVRRAPHECLRWEIEAIKENFKLVESYYRSLEQR